MNGLFDSEGRTMRFLSMFTNVLFLSALWIICSIPIITFGAATTAYFTVMLKVVDNEESYLAHSYLKSFKVNFKIATLSWIIMAIIGAFIYTSIYIVFFAGSMQSKFVYLLPVYVGMFMIYQFTINFLFPYIAQFVDNLKRTLWVSLMLGIKHLGFSFIMLAVDAAIFYLAYQVSILFIILMPAISGYCHAVIIKRIFKQIINNRESDSEVD